MDRPWTYTCFALPNDDEEVEVAIADGSEGVISIASYDSRDRAWFGRNHLESFLDVYAWRPLDTPPPIKKEKS